MSEVKRTNRNQPIGTPRICLCSFQALSSTFSFDSILCRSNLQERHMSGDPRAMQMQSPSSVHLTNMLVESLGGFLILCLQVSSWSSPGPLSYLFSDHSLEVGNLPLSYPSPLNQIQNSQNSQSTPTLRARRPETGIPIHKLALSLQHLPHRFRDGQCTKRLHCWADWADWAKQLSPPFQHQFVPNGQCLTTNTLKTSVDELAARMNSAPIQDLGGHQILRSLKHTESLPHRFLRLPHMHGKRCLSTKV